MNLEKIIKLLYNLYLYLPLILTLATFIPFAYKFIRGKDGPCGEILIFSVGFISLILIPIYFKIAIPFMTSDLKVGGFFYDFETIIWQLIVVTFSILGIVMYEEYTFPKRVSFLFLPALMMFAFEGIPNLISYCIK